MFSGLITLVTIYIYPIIVIKDITEMLDEVVNNIICCKILVKHWSNKLLYQYCNSVHNCNTHVLIIMLIV